MRCICNKLFELVSVKKKMKTVFVGRMGFTGVTVTVVLYSVVQGVVVAVI